MGTLEIYFHWAWLELFSPWKASPGYMLGPVCVREVDRGGHFGISNQEFGRCVFIHIHTYLHV